MKQYLCPPTPFMVKHWPDIVPDWPGPPQAIAVCLLQSQVPLDEDDPPQRREKDRLLHQFLTWGDRHRHRELTPPQRLALISPQDGKPLFSPAGNCHIDLVATVHHCLGLPFVRTPAGCKILIHPQWRSAVYPGLAMTTLPLAAASLFFHLDPAQRPEFPC
ncbi:MAG: hypothetical protein VKL20_00485 [Synechocystis sp.]|nr:hypothetical protein [Synechocystis sp.]